MLSLAMLVVLGAVPPGAGREPQAPRELWRTRYAGVTRMPLAAAGDPRDGSLWLLLGPEGDGGAARLVKLEAPSEPALTLPLDPRPGARVPVPFPVALAPLPGGPLLFHTAADGALRGLQFDEGGLKPPREIAVDDPPGPLTGALAVADEEGAWLVGVKDGRRHAIRYDTRGVVRFRIALAGEGCEGRADRPPLELAADAGGLWLLSPGACAPGVRVERVLAEGREAPPERHAGARAHLAAGDAGARLLVDGDPPRLLSLPGYPMRQVYRAVQSATDSDARVRMTALAAGARVVLVAGVRSEQPWLGALDERGLLAWEGELPIGPVDGSPQLVSAGPRLYLLVPLRARDAAGESVPALEIRAYAGD